MTDDTMFVLGFAVGLAIIVGVVLLAIRRGRRGAVSEFLCDRCKYNNARDCSQADRPNATSCPEFKQR